MWVICLCCFYLIAAMCLLAIFARSYDDNVAMRIGMALLALSSLGRAIRLQNEQAITADAAMFIVAVAIFAAGSGWRHIRWRRVDRRQAERRQHQRRTTETSRSHP